MQHERRGLQAVEGRLDGVEVFRPLGQDQHLAALREDVSHLSGNGRSLGLIVGEMSEDVLDARILRQVDPGMAGVRHHLQIVRWTITWP